jgi:hypothetical protein
VLDRRAAIPRLLIGPTKEVSQVGRLVLVLLVIELGLERSEATAQIAREHVVEALG